MADLVSEKEQDSKTDQKRYYDRNARNRTFEVSDFLTSSSSTMVVPNGQTL